MFDGHVMAQIIGLFILLIGTQTQAAIAVCPAETDQTSTISDGLDAVMRGYRDHLNVADRIAEESSRGIESSRLQIPQAIEQVQLTINCATYVHRNYNGSMIASSILERPASEQQKYLALYKEMTLEFLSKLKNYRDLLQTEWKKPVDQQNYKAAYEQGLDIRDFANHAHRKF